MKKYPQYNLEVLPETEDLYVAVAEFIIDVANKAIAKKEQFTFVLSGGQTPLELYSTLAKHPYRNYIPWERTYVFWGDERYVPLADERNNAYQAKIHLLDKIAIPKSNIHIIPVNLSPEEASKKYEKEIEDFFEGAPPQFDLILLGLGEDGHTASLFPKTKVLNERSEGIRTIEVKAPVGIRITMTAPLINRAHHIVFLVTGKKKEVILKKVLNEPYQPEKYPAQLIKPVDGKLLWFANSAAATGVLLKNL
jgi:6-phosphogluconolactonase